MKARLMAGVVTVALMSPAAGFAQQEQQPEQPADDPAQQEQPEGEEPAEQPAPEIDIEAVMGDLEAQGFGNLEAIDDNPDDGFLEFEGDDPETGERVMIQVDLQSGMVDTMPAQ